MPEGDTVYRLARRLDQRLCGRELRQGRLQVPQHATADLAGCTVLGHDTHGKHLLTRFADPRSDERLTLHTHLRMQGSWTVTGTGRRLPSRLNHEVRVRLECADGPTAYGLNLPVVELLRTRDEARVVGHLGPDPLRADWDADLARARLLAEPGRPLAAALLDQRTVAGLGNLWANELCFLRGHSPWTPVGDIDVDAMVHLAQRALVRSATVPGAYQVTTGDRRRGESHWVAGRAGRACLRCGTCVRVVAEVSGDPERRRTWWCPSCQPGPVPSSSA